VTTRPARTTRTWRRPTPFEVYVAVVLVSGAAALAVAVVGRVPLVWRSVDDIFVVIGLLLIASESRSVMLPRRGGLHEQVSLSGAFACALLLHYDWSLVVAVHALGSLLDDQRSGLPWWKAGFNVGQYTLSLGGAAWVLHAVGSSPTGEAHVSPSVPVALLGCAVFFLLNTSLPGIAIALQEGGRVLRTLRQDLPVQWSINGIVVAMAPLVVAVANDSLWLVGLLVFPVVAVHRGAISALERDHMTLHDPLTGLPNQLAFREQLVEQLEQARHTDRHVAVLVLAPDHIDDVTNTLGPSAADDLITQVADRLRSSVPADAVLARLQGGGFGVAVPDLASPWEADAVAETLLQQFSAPYAFAESAFALRASVGLTVAPLHGTDPEQLMRHAEVARDLALRARSGLEVYSDDRNSFTDRRLAVLRGLGPALRRREMQVHFQPQVDIQTRALTGYEALLRWEHPTLGPVPPDEFVALAEHAGMMSEITDFVLDESLRQLADWRRQGSSATVSVNVSASVLQDPDLPGRVARRLALWGVPSSALVVELTETAVMSHPQRCQQVMRELRALQVGLSLDDYGTGYASLAYLTTLPVDELKIDKSFVLGMRDRQVDRVVVRSTLELAHQLGLRVVAEGVEDEESAALLREYGCRTGQGWLYGRPVPPHEVVLDLTTAAPVRQASGPAEAISTGPGA
jgi:diguanylate cyclase (GGDEF)-like protein